MGRKVRLVGEHLTHTTVWRTAARFLEAGLERPKGSFYPLLAAVVFAYFAFEAYLNTALREVAPDVWRNERKFFASGKYRGTLGKFEYLAELANHPVDKSRPPFQTVRDLSEARDFLGHARVEEFDVVVPIEKLDEPRPYPSVLDSYSGAKFAASAIAAVELLLDGLHQALISRFGRMRFGSTAKAFSGISGGWHASTTEEKVPKMPIKARQPTSLKSRRTRAKRAKPARG